MGESVEEMGCDALRALVVVFEDFRRYPMSRDSFNWLG
jgi:hypothetical protein